MSQSGVLMIEVGGQDLRVSFNYSASTPDVMYLPNGDPGYPGEEAEFDITKVELAAHRVEGGKVVQNWLDVTDLVDELRQMDEGGLTDLAEAAFVPEEQEPEEPEEREERGHDY